MMSRDKFLGWALLLALGMFAAAVGAVYAQSAPRVAYYLCGNTWFSAFYGANGVSYRVVPTP
jgi:hypothetical protein